MEVLKITRQPGGTGRVTLRTAHGIHSRRYKSIDSAWTVQLRRVLSLARLREVRDQVDPVAAQALLDHQLAIVILDQLNA